MSSEEDIHQKKINQKCKPSVIISKVTKMLELIQPEYGVLTILHTVQFRSGYRYRFEKK